MSYLQLYPSFFRASAIRSLSPQISWDCRLSTPGILLSQMFYNEQLVSSRERSKQKKWHCNFSRENQNNSSQSFFLRISLTCHQVVVSVTEASWSLKRQGACQSMHLMVSLWKVYLGVDATVPSKTIPPVIMNSRNSFSFSSSCELLKQKNNRLRIRVIRTEFNILVIGYEREHIAFALRGHSLLQ